MSRRWSWGLLLSALLGLTSGAVCAQSFSRAPLGNADTLGFPTSLQWGPDGRLYVAELIGRIRVYTVERTGPGAYQAAATETIRNIELDIGNHNDDGTPHTGVGADRRQVTGMVVTGTAANPVIYVSSSDYRVAIGEDSGLDTNSGIISRLTWDGTEWVHLDLVRGLPRNEENHSPNGMWLDESTNTLYLAQGGNTNMGAPSNNFAFQSEYALSAAVLTIDLDAIGEATYDLPTLDDPDRPGNPDFNDPFGGNNGLNQAIIVPGGPVQVYATGFRNAYDLLKHSNGRLYTIDNGPNQGWGGPPLACSNATNELDAISYGDGLHLITGQGYYGGHPNPTRASMANTFGGQSPISVANPVECDFLIPGVEDASLWVFPASTNGICEYTASNFGGAMQGDMLAMDTEGTLHRVELSPDGTSVVNVTSLVQNGGALALDVVARGDGESYAGSIWYTAFLDKAIYVLEPMDFAGCTGENSFLLDEDGDGFSNADEILNGTDVCSGASAPADADGDFLSDLLDDDDDNDGQLDHTDAFAIDGTNGATADLPFFFGWGTGEPGYGFAGLGFTGLMADGVTDYADQYDPANLTAGGAAGRLTIDNVSVGTPANGDNAQDTAFQMGLRVGEHKGAFRVGTRVDAPFFGGLQPTPGQAIGFFVGNGDQDNYVSIEFTAVRPQALLPRLLTLTRSPRNQTGRLDAFANGLRRLKTADLPGLRVTYETDGVVQSVYEEAWPSVLSESFVRVDVVIDPAAGTVQPRAALGDGAFEPVGDPIDVGGAVLDALLGDVPLATGILASTGGDRAFAGTWDYIEGSIIDSGARARFDVVTPNPGLAGSTFSNDSFRIQNDSTSGQQIEWIEYDFRTSVLGDMLIDPDGLAGDTIGKGFTPNLGEVETGLTGFTYLHPRDFGFEGLHVSFDGFDAGEEFRFSMDMDPSTIQGGTAPGPFGSGSVSGIELAGSRVRVGFSDGTVLAGTLNRRGTSLNDAISELRPGMPSAPIIELLGVGTGPADVSEPEQTLRVSGPRGATVRILKIDGGLFLEGLPGGGFDVDPFEANTIVGLQNIEDTIGADGFVDVPVTLSRARVESGINHMLAVVLDNDGSALASNRVVARLRQTAFAATPDPVEFGEVVVGSPATLTVQISNPTDGDLTLDSIELSGSPDVAITQMPQLPMLIPMGGTADVELQAAPLIAGAFDATLIIASSGPVTTTEVPVSGLGKSPATMDPIVFRLNAGGPEAAPLGGTGPVWGVDTPSVPSPVVSVLSPAWITSAGGVGVAPPLDASVPQSVADTARAGGVGETLSLSVPLVRDDYLVRLYFAEIDPGVVVPGQRIMDISAEGVSVLSGIDIISLAGTSNLTEQYFTVTLVDGVLDIDIVPVSGGAILSGVEIIRVP